MTDRLQTREQMLAGMTDTTDQQAVTVADVEAARPFMDRYLDGSSFADDRLDLAKAFAAHRLAALATQPASQEGDGLRSPCLDPRGAQCGVCGDWFKHTSAGYCSTCIRNFKVPDHTETPLATQPATSQEGEAAVGDRVRIRDDVRRFGGRIGTVERFHEESISQCPVELRLDDGSSYCFRAREIERLAATPTPPTLSEDLREALGEARLGFLALAGEVDDETQLRWSKRHIAKIDAALAQVKAS